MTHSDAVYEFGPFQIEPGERRLSRAGQPIALPPKAFDLLVILVEHPDQLLRKEDLIEQLWAGVFVEEVNLAQNISTIRRALGGDGREAFIQTVAGTGYRFVAPVRRAGAPDEDRLLPRPRLLVLPFRLLKPDAELAFLEFSLSDALTSALSGLDAVVVRSSLVAARFADAPDLPRIAREADVDLVVSGTLLRAGDQLRVAAQLAEAASGRLLWTQQEQAPVGDLFRLQDSLIDRIVASLSRPLTQRDSHQIRRDVPATPKAYEYYLRANQAARDDSTLTIARDLYLQAIDEDPRYAPAWTRLARVYRVLGKYRLEDIEVNLAQARDALARALALNPDLSMAHTLYAYVEVDSGRAIDAMVRLLTRGRERGGDAEIFAGLVQACRYSGMLDASVAAHTQAQHRDPALVTSVMHTYFVMRRYEDVLSCRGLVTGYVSTMSLAALGRGDDARRSLDRLEQQKQRIPSAMLRSARGFLTGDREDSAEAMAEVLRVHDDPETRLYGARHFALLGDFDRSLGALSRALDGGYGCLGPMESDPWFEPVRSQKRFQEILRRARVVHDAAATAFREHGGGAILQPSQAGV